MNEKRTRFIAAEREKPSVGTSILKGKSASCVSHEAFIRAYHMARSRMKPGAMRGTLGLSWQDEEDHLQEAAVRIWSKVSEGTLNLDSEEHCFNLMRTVSRHAGIDAWRKETRSGRIILDSLSAFDLETRARPWDPEKVFELGDVLRSLTPEDRELLYARVFMEMSWKEVSRLLGTTEQAARVRFFRLRRRLAEILEQGLTNAGKDAG